LDSTATSVPLPGQHNQTADPSADGATGQPCLPDPATKLVREDRFLRDCAVLKDHMRGVRTDASAVTADTILEDIYARI
jgi:hypothetical protein